MKIYTEVNYEFKDGRLVEQSSESFEYSGEVAECKGVGTFFQPITSGAKAALEQSGINKKIREGPGGDLGKAVDKVYGGTLKEDMESYKEPYTEFEEYITGKSTVDKLQEAAGTLLAPKPDVVDSSRTPEEGEALLEQGIVDEGGRKRKFGRTAMIEGSQGASILAPNTA